MLHFVRASFTTRQHNSIVITISIIDRRGFCRNTRFQNGTFYQHKIILVNTGTNLKIDICSTHIMKHRVVGCKMENARTHIAEGTAASILLCY